SKSVEEVKEETKKLVVDTEDTSLESVGVDEENGINENIIDDENEVETVSKGVIETDEIDEIKEEKKENLQFSMPVDGEIIKEYAKDKLVYSDTLKEWVTHEGIDIQAKKTTVVKASEEGIVKSIKNDPRYGLTVVINHADGFSTVYSNLLTAEFVNVGEEVEKGQTIGTVGNTASFEIADESHLHFEILKDNTRIDPNMYLK
ncbi:MAG: M23 family metallopeptidase, partial [Clostridia bacterium]|nr:M23 family metallopeptidase [Clostridia bacterium]